MHHHERAVSLTCDTPEEKITRREAGGSHGSSALQRPEPHAEGTALQCPATPTTAHRDPRRPDYISVPAITPLLILECEMGRGLDAARVSRPGAIRGAGLCWGLCVNCVLKLLQLLETGFFVRHLHQRRGRKLGEAPMTSSH